VLAVSERVAAALLRRFEPGEKVAVWAPNTLEWILLEYGAALAGLVLVTINPAYRAPELSYVLKQSRAAGIFLLPEYRNNPMAASLESVRPELQDLRDVVFFADWAEFVESGGATAKLPTVNPEDAVQIQYTSGTTGLPKGAALHHMGVTNNARFFVDRMKLPRSSVLVSAMPLFHTAGCFMGVLGCAQALATLVPVLAFEPNLMISLMEVERADSIIAVPTMLVALLEQPSLTTADLRSLRVVVSGGSPVPPDLVHRVEARLEATFMIVFGTTECSPLLSTTQLDDTTDDRASTLGRPLPQTDVKIADLNSNEPTAIGEVGELCARGYLVMKEYNDNPEATHVAIDRDGWYHTGDLASMDARGYLRIEGRAKDMIIRGGENIYPREIEEALLTYPGVTEVAVVGSTDERWGESVAAFIRRGPGATVSEPDLVAHCKERLAPYKMPVKWVFVDSFPMTASGKIQKFKLKELLLHRAG
jgi:fatty-acyl-CoA synthase